MDSVYTSQVSKTLPLPEYPRPQMVRHDWLNLNGLWEYAINRDEEQMGAPNGQILVPFSPEAPLSGAVRGPKPDEYLWYRRSIEIPERFADKNVVLHFGAVDRNCEVWVNGLHAMHHSGGYLPFEADITGHINGSTVNIVVRVQDETDRTEDTRGKQKTKRGGIWYTPQSGIWQTVWVEFVPRVYITDLKITPDFDNSQVKIEALTSDWEETPVTILFEGREYPAGTEISLPAFLPWSPEHPHLYSFTAKCGDDSVESYFAMRKFSVGKDANGIQRLMLNNRPYFQNGLLDQGYWPDGLYTAPTDEALIRDITVMKSMGFNMLRKHIKVEPLRWYYHCDRLGMIVWQDMPSGGGRYDPLIVSAPLITNIHLKDSHYRLFSRKDASCREDFLRELGEMTEHLYNCPCIGVWVPFNEGWGQFDSTDIANQLQAHDPTRVIDPASGWHDQGTGKVRSWHVYFKPYKFTPDKHGRAVLLSEFGGYTHAVEGHTFNNRAFGYRNIKTPEELQNALRELYQNQIRPAVAQGLAATVYTQVSDVEDELNGLMTYDRALIKVPPEVMREIIKVED